MWHEPESDVVVPQPRSGTDVRHAPGALTVADGLPPPIVEGNVRAKREGRRLGNLRHHPQDELSDAERRRRLEWLSDPFRPCGRGRSGGAHGLNRRVLSRALDERRIYRKRTVSAHWGRPYGDGP